MDGCEKGGNDRKKSQQLIRKLWIDGWGVGVATIIIKECRLNAGITGGRIGEGDFL